MFSFDANLFLNLIIVYRYIFKTKLFGSTDLHLEFGKKFLCFCVELYILSKENFSKSAMYRNIYLKILQMFCYLIRIQSSRKRLATTWDRTSPRRTTVFRIRDPVLF